MKYQLTGASQEGYYKDKSSVIIKRGDIVIPIIPIGFWQKLKSFITGYRWYYFEKSNERLFQIHDSIIERCFEEVR